MSSALDFLQTWFRAQCNGFWEHANGVTIETLDNRGWMVTIDLAETALDGQSMKEIRKEHNEKDWLVCTVSHNKFRGEGDSAKLGTILEAFQAWAGEAARSANPKPAPAPEKSRSIPGPANPGSGSARSAKAGGPRRA